MSDMLALTARADRQGIVSLSCEAWPSLLMEGLRPSLWVDGSELALIDVAVEGVDADTTAISYHFESHLRLAMTLSTAADTVIELRGTLSNDGDRACALNDVVLLGLDSDRGGRAAFAPDARRPVLLEQGNYWGHVRRISEPPDDGRVQAEPDGASPRVSGTSDLVWAVHDADGPAALVVGFLTSERWLGRVETEADGGGRVRRWRLGFDGGDVLLEPGQELDLEEAILLAGRDPWRLLEEYGDRVAVRHGTSVAGDTPVTWCSWYPFRLGVTEQRILDTARIAAQRLQPLGLSVVEIDLGWQSGNLPSTFDENERFPGGLRRLADALAELGLELGVWTAPYSISELDPLAAEHPEYLVLDEDGKPAASGSWFWEPHGKVHILDLTSPGAQRWLREQIGSLAARGVRYLKADFISCVGHAQARQRHDPTVAAGGATEAGRIGADIMRAAMGEGQVLNCGGPEMPGAGALPLLYTCNDTGNTGFISTAFQRRNTLTLACHLWKNRRWGIIQASCLCVGPPGTVEDARLRATIAFLSGGQIDISDNLETLPEDRWAILAATLPSLGRSATPIDLFEPLSAVAFDYEQSTRGEDLGDADLPHLPPGSLWHLRVEAGWDAWDLVGVFSFPDDVDTATPALSRFAVPFSRLGLPADDALTGFEFWSSQYLGAVPGRRRNDGGYSHPGDFQDLLAGDAPGTLDVAFYGPAARLIRLHRTRSHPWVAGTSFHQSCGGELTEVSWNEESAELSGVLNRPAGELGTLTLTTSGRQATSARVDGAEAPVRGDGESVVLPILTRSEETRWQVCFSESPRG